MILLGLTGPIACGKTTVLQMLEYRGAKSIDSDQLVHELMAPGLPVWEGIVATFGPDNLLPDQTINRKRLGETVFGDQKAMHRLERIIHPAVVEEIESRLQSWEQRNTGRQQETVAVLEAIKLIEGGYHTRCHAVWIVTCDSDVQIRRLVKTRALTEEEARLRLRSQPGWSEKMRFADLIIHNNGSRKDLERQVEQAWRQLLGREVRNDENS